MTSPTDFATPAHLIADTARASMLGALLGGCALSAGELARVAGITAQTASSHLSKLLEGGLLAVEAEGRRRYYRLTGPQVAEALELLATVRQADPPRPRASTKSARDLRFCRSCYNHLAGQVGVAVTDALQARGCLRADEDRQFTVTADGEAWFARQGLDIRAIRTARRPLARQCLDWTERRHHLAGPLGTSLLELLCRKRWLRREPRSRLVVVTPLGWTKFASELSIRRADLPAEGAGA